MVVFNSLKCECDKAVQEKSELQRHYVLYYEITYGLNIEMHRQVWKNSKLPSSTDGNCQKT